MRSRARRAATAAATAVMLACAPAWAPASAAPTGAVPSAAESSVRSQSALRPVATLTVPALGLRRVPVVAHRGAPDDRAGTAIQDRGLLAMPVGPAGGVLPGAVGNLVITGHRTSGARTFLGLPRLRAGQPVVVGYGRWLLTYRITGYLVVDVTDRRSLAGLASPVPGRPGVPATRPMISLVTCATVEDNARGDRWRDANHNPRHRIVRYGVLVSKTRA